ncbi:PREDICTED: uncharacterized protein LOC108556866 [Nicrophorus vespilloides]|uniref:Gustatory receptor n=1 Tax=Nicrophorus vespilloides TaxID=110193 RepID=A0ABM1M236_NICVS|nr:PREDICTED: uncharacterized protein LOC108556866 [Nicrophorus vespilloides]
MSESFYDAISAFLGFSKLFSMTSITSSDNTSKYKCNHIIHFLSLVHLVIVAFTYYLSFDTDGKYVGNSDIYFLSYFTYDMLNMIRFVVIYIRSSWKVQKEIDMYRAVDEFDAKLEGNDDMAAANNWITRQSFALLSLAILSQTLTETFVALISYKVITANLIICKVLPAFTGTLRKCYYFLWTCWLRKRFEIINKRLLTVKKRSKVNRRHVFSVYSFHKELDELMEMYKKLGEITRNVNEYFNIELLLHFLLLFDVVFANGYYMSFVLNLNDSTFLYIFTVIKNYIYLLFESYSLVYSSTLLCKEAAKSKMILNRIRVDPYDENAHGLMITSIYELKENQVTISVCRLFSINKAMMFGMMSNISNYIFIMLQLEYQTENTD